jgi:peptide/nickel transport system substrate-binding protein
MDDQNWPIDGVNVINFGSEVPWPDWWEYSVYQPLVTVNDTAEFSSGAIQYLPVLATNYTSTNGNMTWTFNLRQNVTFSNGDPFNAYQLWADLYSEYYLSGNSSGWWQSYTIFDMSNVDFGPNTLALMNSTNDQLVHPNSQMLTIMSNSSWPIHVTGPNQIVFQLKAPFLYLLGTFVSYIGMVFDTQYVLNNGGIGTAGAPNTKFDTSPIPGTGPYSISGVSTNSYVQFAQYSGYWGSNLTPAQIASNPILDPGHYKSVVINDVADDLSRYTALSSGAAQIAAITSTAEWPLVLGNPNEFSYTTLPSWSSEGPFAVAINANLYPTNITAVRQAIVQAINYSDIIQTVFNGEMLPTMGPESPLYPQYYDLGNFSAYQYNPTNATNILKAAGLNPSSLGTLTFRTEADCAMCAGIAQIVQADLEQIGFTVTISQVAGSAYDTVYGSYSTNVANAAQIGQLSLLGGQSWAPSALTAADNWVSLVSNTSSWGNWAGFSTPQIQACVNAFTSTSSVSQIQALCKTAQAQIYNDAPYAWIGNAKLWYYTGSLVWKTGTIKSFDLDPVWDGVNTMPLINTVVPG